MDFTTFVFSIGTILIIVWYCLRNYRYHLMSAKLTGPPTLPLIGNFFQLTSRKNGLQKMMNFHKKYGLRFRAWLVHHFVFFTINPADVRAVLNSPDALEKSEIFYDNIGSLIGPAVLISKVTKWKVNRKIMQSTFSRTIVESYCERIEIRCRTLMRTLSSEFAQNDNIFKYFHKYSMDLFCTNMLDYDVHTNPLYDEFRDKLTLFTELTFVRMQKPWWSSDRIFFNLSPDGHLVKDAIRVLRQFTQNVVDTKFDDQSIDKNQDRAHFLHTLQHNVHKGELDQQDLENEVIAIMIAATETISLGLSFMCLVLGMYPAVQDRIYDELQDVLGKPLNTNDLLQLKYLERTVFEVLRLFPSVPQIARHTMADIHLDDGLVIPKGADVVINLFGMHRMDTIWPEPMKFDPDRFLPDLCAQRHPGSYIPFSKGQRDCFGLRYSMLVLKITLANLVGCFEIRSPYKQIDEIQVKSHIFLYAENGFPIQLIPRPSNGKTI